MLLGPDIIEYIRQNGAAISSMHINGHPTEGFLELCLQDGRKQVFCGWDREDQGYFACALNGEQWTPDKLGIPASLKIKSNKPHLKVDTDKPIAIVVNDKPLNEWGKKVSEDLWKKRDNKEPLAKNCFGIFYRNNREAKLDASEKSFIETIQAEAEDNIRVNIKYFF